jgi:hypothetical protein
MNNKSIIVVDYCSPNERDHFRIFHTRFIVSKSRIENFDKPLRPSSERYLREVGEPGITLVRRIISIPGVIKVWIEPYEIAVEISKAYSFEEIEPKVLEALKSVVPAEMLEEKRPLISYIPISEKGNFFTNLSIKVKTISSRIANWFKNIFK